MTTDPVVPSLKNKRDLRLELEAQVVILHCSRSGEYIFLAHFLDIATMSAPVAGVLIVQQITCTNDIATVTNLRSEAGVNDAGKSCNVTTEQSNHE
jgi:hypothetical protein